MKIITLIDLQSAFFLITHPLQAGTDQISRRFGRLSPLRPKSSTESLCPRLPIPAMPSMRPAKTGLLRLGLREFLIFSALWTATLFPAMAATAPLEGIRRVVFLGDSITHTGDYVADVECWLLSRGHRLEIFNIGLSSETATELTAAENAEHLKSAGFPRPFIGERLDRSLALVRPDLLFVCYGMNDASDLPEGPEGLNRYIEGLTRLRDAALRAGAKRVVLCTPPVYDPKKPISPPKRRHGANLEAYREWLLSKRSVGWDVVDIHGPMRRDLDYAKKLDPAFRYQADGVHPNRVGHWVMAREILSQFFAADLQGISSSPQFFEKNGEQIRDLVKRRMKIRYDSLMTQIGHSRPKIPGGPDSPAGPFPAAAEAQSTETAKSIDSLLAP